MKAQQLDLYPTEEGLRAKPRRAVIEAIIDACHHAVSEAPEAADSTGEEMTCAMLTMALRVCHAAVLMGADRAKLRQAVGMILMVAADETVH